MEMKRGDVVVCAAPGDCGKHRAAVVVQADLFNGTHASVLVCLITSRLAGTGVMDMAGEAGPVGAKPSQGLSPTPPLPTLILTTR